MAEKCQDELFTKNTVFRDLEKVSMKNEAWPMLSR